MKCNKRHAENDDAETADEDEVVCFVDNLFEQREVVVIIDLGVPVSPSP